MSRRRKGLCEHDRAELRRFTEYIADLEAKSNGKLPASDFVDKWKEYMNLSDAEAAAMKAGESHE